MITLSAANTVPAKKAAKARIAKTKTVTEFIFFCMANLSLLLLH
jgi:hypothetical protein